MRRAREPEMSQRCKNAVEVEGLAHHCKSSVGSHSAYGRSASGSPAACYVSRLLVIEMYMVPAHDPKNKNGAVRSYLRRRNGAPGLERGRQQARQPLPCATSNMGRWRRRPARCQPVPVVDASAACAMRRWGRSPGEAPSCGGGPAGARRAPHTCRINSRCACVQTVCRFFGRSDGLPTKCFWATLVDGSTLVG